MALYDSESVSHLEIFAPTFAVTLFIAVLSLVVVFGFTNWISDKESPAGKEEEDAAFLRDIPEPTELARSLKVSIPQSVFFPTDLIVFREIMSSYWAKNNQDIIPACFVRPRDVGQLQGAISLIKQEHERQKKKGRSEPLFAVKSGGASPALGGSNYKGGVVIDLALFRDIHISKDRSTVTLGAGLKWADAYAALELEGVTVAGGRTLPVGVGGLSLQGGLSYYSPSYGFVCSSIISYNVILADGSAVIASETSYTDLFRALKGGAHNFGIVTSFTLPCFPASKIWFDCSYMLGFQSHSLLKAFHDWVDETQTGEYDENSSVPLSCFGYTSAGIHATANYLIHTKPISGKKMWPSYWKKSPFGKLFSLYGTAKTRTLLHAVKELSDYSEPGHYNIMATMTCKNDMATLKDIHEVHRELCSNLKKVKGLVISTALQPILPQWANKGYPNVLGLDGLAEPLIIVEINSKWTKVEDYGFVMEATKRAIEKMEAYAEVRKTGHRYKFTNYCAEWQDPMRGYGEENLAFMRDVSAKYDPQGLFQTGCSGRFKL